MDNNNGLLNSYSETLISGYEIRSFIDPLLAYEDTNVDLRKYSLLNTDFIEWFTFFWRIDQCQYSKGYSNINLRMD